MAYVVTDNCVKCRFTDCVAVCPVDCFHADGEMVYIDPNVCIDCGACEPQCPVHAIYEETSVPGPKKQWIQINAERSQTADAITQKEAPLPTADARKKELGF
jgi:ferredoxin